jgi:hypothetical protein
MSSYIKCKNLTTDLTDKHGLLVSNLYFVRVGLCLSVVKLKTRSSAYTVRNLILLMPPPTLPIACISPKTALPTLYIAGPEALVRSSEVLVRSREVLVGSREVHAGSREVHVRSREVHVRSNEVLAGSREVLVRSRKVLAGSSEMNHERKKRFVLFVWFVVKEVLTGAGTPD